MSEGFTPRRAPPSVDGVLDPAPRVPASIPDAAPTKTDIASRASRSSFGLMAKGPAIQAAVAALTLHYENLDPLMGDIEVLGDKLYLTATAFQKQMQSQVPLIARRWVKRFATIAEYDQLMLEPWRPNPREDQRGYMGYGSRVWFVELWIRPWRYLAVAPGESQALAVPVEGAEWYCAASAFGEASEQNCMLENASKLKGDPRVLDRMALKRAEHEALREVVSFTLRGARNVNQVQLLQAGVTLSLAGPDDLDVPAEPASPVAVRPADANPKLRDYAKEIGIPPRFIDDAVAVAAGTEDPYFTLGEYREQIRPVEARPANQPAAPAAVPAVAPQGAPAVDPGPAATGAKPAKPSKPKKPGAAAAAPVEPAPAEPPADGPAAQGGESGEGDPSAAGLF